MQIRDLRPMAVGEVLDRSFQVLRGHVATLFVTAVLGTAPLLLVYLSAGMPYGAAIPEEQFAAVGGVMLLMVILFLVTITVSWAALTRQVDQAVAGSTVSVGDGLRQGLRAFPRVIVLAILVYLIGVALAVPAAGIAAVVGGVLGMFLGTETVAVVLTVSAMAAAFVAVALLWAPMAFLSLPALIAEGLGPLRALRRAHELGRGGRVRIMGTAIVAWIVMMLPAFGLPFLFGFGMALWTPEGAGTVPATQLYLYQAVSFLVGGLTTPFLVAVMVFTYYDRRVRREGFDVELASESIAQNVP